MWQYIKGVKPPTQKRKLDEEEKKQHSADYEKKHQRKYDRKWEETFPWLSTNDDGKMICRPCIDYPTLSDKDCSFIHGSSNFKVTEYASLSAFDPLEAIHL